jgi:hypothetical protein
MNNTEGRISPVLAQRTTTKDMAKSKTATPANVGGSVGLTL